MSRYVPKSALTALDRPGAYCQDRNDFCRARGEPGTSNYGQPHVAGYTKDEIESYSRNCVFCGKVVLG